MAISNNFIHKGFCGSCDYDCMNDWYRGKILNTSDLVTYEARTKQELAKEFKIAVEDYIETRKKIA